MAAANVVDVTELPDFDEETGVLPKDDDSGRPTKYVSLLWSFILMCV